jgi:hypothetical protein
LLLWLLLVPTAAKQSPEQASAATTGLFGASSEQAASHLAQAACGFAHCRQRLQRCQWALRVGKEDEDASTMATGLLAAK